ncbi:MAG: response regulator transcription factor [Gemmatimonadetes bacterium]|nr:response regulator transcription factor [Gemmatimonadota bacterium]
MRVLVVDDEPLARQRILGLLAEAPDMEVVGECGDGEAAIESIEALRPDLVFLDIQMPEVTGLEVLEAVEVDPMPVVVFVTAYDEFALRAFDAHALDYLLKPFRRERFEATLARVRAHLAARSAHQRELSLDDRIRALLATLHPARPYPERLAVRLGERIVFVRVADVDWIGAEGNYAALHVGERQYLIRETMSRLEAKLDPARFVRIQRSVIVNADRIREIQPLFKGTYTVVLQGGAKLTSGRSYRDNLLALIDTPA